MSSATTANYSDLKDKGNREAIAERFQSVLCSPSCLCSMNQDIAVEDLIPKEDTNKNHLLPLESSTSDLKISNLINVVDNQHTTVPDGKAQYTSTPLLDKLQDMDYKPSDSSPVLKRPRLSSDAFPTGGESIHVALVTLPAQKWEIPHLDDIKSKCELPPEEEESFDREMNEIRRLECFIDDLEKQVELMAAVSLPFVKEHSACCETSDACTTPEKNDSRRSNLREIEVQTDLISEKETVEIGQLKCLVDEQQRALIKKSQELETAQRTIEHKEIGFATASDLLRISFEECVRKSMEAQAAKAAVYPTQHVPLTVTANTSTVSSILSVAPGRQSTPESIETRVSAPAQASNSMDSPSAATKCEFTKDEYSRLNRRSVKGVYEGAFPLQPELMRRFANGNIARDFVKILLEHCFTDDYLATNTLTLMDEKHVEEITNATLTYFSEYRTRKDTTLQTLNKPTVRSFITTVLSSRKAAAKRRSLQLV